MKREREGKKEENKRVRYRKERGGKEKFIILS